MIMIVTTMQFLLLNNVYAVKQHSSTISVQSVKMKLLLMHFLQ